MNGRVIVVSAVTALSVAGLAGVSTSASADITVPPVGGLPSVTVTVPPVLPSTAPSVPSLPVPTPSSPSLPTTPGGGGGGGGTGGGNGSAPSGPTAGGGGADQPGAAASAPGTGNKKKGSPTGAAGKSPVQPMIAGRPEAADALDDESTPQLYRATKRFLAVDGRIADLATLRDRMASTKAQAVTVAQTYRALQLDAANLRAEADQLHDRADRLRRILVNDARRSYQTGRPAMSDSDARDLVAAASRALDAATRAEMRLGSTLTQQQQTKAQFDTLAATYNADKDKLDAINRQLEALAQQREAALNAVEAARPGELARQRQTIAESGSLGAQIRAASARLAAQGRTVTGTGQFIRPSSGVVTSPYGQRYHPILHITKLHTGTDFAVGDGFAHAADDGRVLFTIVSVAYGNFTIIDHGVIDGRHITTCYAHQAKFLVQPGDVVHKGQRIGIIGSTGYSTGPHLHFEVRDNGAVENPMFWLS